MPSKRSPSQRTPEGRQGRQMAALSGGSNAGRMISASGRGVTAPSSAAPSGGGDTTHAGSGTQSIQLGDTATATNTYSVGLGSHAASSAVAATSLGPYTTTSGSGAIAIGFSATATGVRSIAIGGLTNSVAYTAKIAADTFEVESASSPGGPSGMIVTDAAGVRWKITVDTTGHLTTTAL